MAGNQNQNPDSDSQIAAPASGLARRTSLTALPGSVDVSEGRTSDSAPRTVGIRWTIAHKLAVPIAGLLVVIVGFLSTLFQLQQSQLLLEQLKAKGDTYAQLASEQVRSAVAFNDRETAREVFDSLASDSDLMGVTLFLQSGTVLHSWGRLSELSKGASAGVAKRQVFDLGDRILAVSPVVSLEGPRGTLGIELSKNTLIQGRDSARRMALLLGGLSLVLGVAVALWIAQSFARRLGRISQVAAKVAAGDLSQALTLDKAEDEIGSLSRSFALMLQQIRQLFSDAKEVAEQEQQRLEQLVQVRTAEVQARSMDMRRILDNVDQGFFTLERDGTISKERSKILMTWLGTENSASTLWDYLDPLSAGLGAMLEVSWEAVVEGFLPLELNLSQMPSQFAFNNRTLSIRYQPILDDAGELKQALVVLSDITAELQREQAHAEENELLQMFSRLLEDRPGVIEFVAETTTLLSQLAEQPARPMVERARLLHTLKGNSAVFGLQSLSVACHQIEDELSESGKGLSLPQVEILGTRWRKINARLSGLLGEVTEGSIVLDDQDHREILEAVARGQRPREIASMIEAWRLEPTKLRLDRAARQLEQMAKKLGKLPLSVRVESNRVRMNSNLWKPFWGAFPHLLRNAVDHGLETIDERQLAKKADEATITLITLLTEREFRVEVQDSGRGINWEQVAFLARERGLPSGTEDELAAALFSDGLSTRGEVSEVSGRGVGMGALKQAVEERGGKIRVTSVKGQGCCFIMTWPASVASGPAASGNGGAARLSISVGLGPASIPPKIRRSQ